MVEFAVGEKVQRLRDDVGCLHNEGMGDRQADVVGHTFEFGTLY